jgi:hypothetical protein
MLTFDSKICGIPCRVGILSWSPGRCNRVGHIDNWLPDDPPELEFEVLDHRGRPAPWLEKKMTEADTSRIEAEAEAIIEKGAS